MSMPKPLALASLLALLTLGSAGTTPAIRPASASRSAKPTSSLGHYHPADGTNLPPGSGTPPQGAKLYRRQRLQPMPRRRRPGGIANMLVGSPPLIKDGIASNKTIANFWGQPIDAVRLHPPRHAVAEAAYAHRRRGLRHLRLSVLGQQADRPDDTMNAQTLPKVKMPNRDNFIIKFPDKI